MVTTSKVVGMLPKRIARLLYNVSKVRFEGGKEEAVQGLEARTITTML